MSTIQTASSFARAMQDVEARYSAANPKSGARYREACEVMPGGNTRIAIYYSPFPLTIARGEGAYLWDIDGHRYTDFMNDMSAGLFGHSNPVIAAAVRSAVDDGLTLGAPNQYDVELAGVLAERFPSIELVRFCNSGTEANLFALALARAVTGRQKVLGFRGGYHGGVFADPGSAFALNAPLLVGAPYNDIEGTLEVIEREAHDLAAIVVEPMMGSAGCIPAKPEFLQALRDASRKHDIILVFDEVMTSRLSPGGLQAALGIVPDMTTMGKYIGGGLTFGAFGGRRDLMERLDPRRSDMLSLGGTFNNSVTTMAAGLTAMTQVLTPEANRTLNRRGDDLRRRMNAAGAQRGLPVQVTGVGSLMNVHFQHSPIEAPSDVVPGNKRIVDLLHLELLLEGQYIARRGYISLSLALTSADVDGFVAAFERFLDRHSAVIQDVVGPDGA